jgi:hypothetical protein
MSESNGRDGVVPRIKPAARKPKRSGGRKAKQKRLPVVFAQKQRHFSEEGETASSTQAMAEQHKAEAVKESLMEKISDKLHGRGDGSSSSSDSDDDVSSAAVKAKIYRLFGREKSVHSVLGGGKRESRPMSSPPFLGFSDI